MRDSILTGNVSSAMTRNDGFCTHVGMIPRGHRGYELVLIGDVSRVRPSDGITSP